MKVYHIVYEPTSRSVDIHFWTRCNLKCRACYTRFETLDFGLYDDPTALIAKAEAAAPPRRFLTLTEVMDQLDGREISSAVFIGTEPALDPEMPALAAALHRKFHSYIILLTNGLKLADLSDVDEVIFSLKAISPELHRAYTGRGNRAILGNLARLHQQGVKMQVETVLIPGLTDEAETEKVAEFVAGIDLSVPLRIDAYFPVPGCPWKAATRAQVEDAAALAARHLKKVSILTLDMKRTGTKPIRIV